MGVDFALKIIKLSETQSIRLQLWDIAGKCSGLRIQHEIFMFSSHIQHSVFIICIEARLTNTYDMVFYLLFYGYLII
jgi:GTPase SAR1 family protein